MSLRKVNSHRLLNAKEYLERLSIKPGAHFMQLLVRIARAASELNQRQRFIAVL
ncbi:MAG: hypothetical protein HKM24_02685 [Gammaproteobacteria bacterium]|nr:hypothetical protein [Gammaproteobacteria bacterium]